MLSGIGRDNNEMEFSDLKKIGDYWDFQIIMEKL